MTGWKTAFLALAPCALAPLSTLGALGTLLTIHRSRKRGKLTTHHRLLNGVASFDLMASIATALGPLPLPSDDDETEEEEGMMKGYGNRATCIAQGALFQIGSVGVFYNMMLLFFYVLILSFGWKDDDLRHGGIESLMHAVPIGFAVATVLVGLVLQVFNPAISACWVADQPLGCADNPHLDCQRGESASFFFMWLNLVPEIAAALLLLLFSTVLTLTIWWRFHQHHPKPPQQDAHIAEEREFGVQDSSIHEAMMAQKGNMVITQVVLYSVTMTNCGLWSALASLRTIRGQQDVFAITALAVVFCPLQGLFNFVIFLRPRYCTIQRHMSISPYLALVEAVWYPADTMALRKDRRRIGQALSEFSYGSRMSSAYSNSNGDAVADLGRMELHDATKVAAAPVPERNYGSTTITTTTQTSADSRSRNQGSGGSNGDRGTTEVLGAPAEIELSSAISSSSACIPQCSDPATPAASASASDTTAEVADDEESPLPGTHSNLQQQPSNEDNELSELCKVLLENQGF